MRICANYAYMRILCVDAQMMRICAEYAYMRILRVYAPYGRGRKTLRIPRENGPGGRGLGNWAGSAPSLSCLAFRCVSEPQETLTYIYPAARHAGPRGRRTSPACGSCRRPLKSNEKQGIEESNGGKKKYSASKEGTLRPSREGTKCIIFLPILERESKSRKNQ